MTLQISSQFYFTVMQTSNKNYAEYQLGNMVITGHGTLGKDNIYVWLSCSIKAL